MPEKDSVSPLMVPSFEEPQWLEVAVQEPLLWQAMVSGSGPVMHSPAGLQEMMCRVMLNDAVKVGAVAVPPPPPVPAPPVAAWATAEVPPPLEPEPLWLLRATATPTTTATTTTTPPA